MDEAAESGGAGRAVRGTGRGAGRGGRAAHGVRGPRRGTGKRRRAADRRVSPSPSGSGRLAGQARGAAGEAERADAAAARAQEALDTALAEVEELAERLAVAEEHAPSGREGRRSPTPPCATGSPPTAPTPARPRWRPVSRSAPTRNGSRGSPGGPTPWTGPPARNARHARACRAAAGPAAARGGRRRGRGLRRPATCWRTSRSPSPAPTRSAPPPRPPRPTASRNSPRTEGRDLKAAKLLKSTDSVHRGEVLGAEKRLRIEQLETKALEELGVEPAGLVAEYGPHESWCRPRPPPRANSCRRTRAPAQQPRPFVRAEQEKRLQKAAERLVPAASAR
ncbi:Chromosome partition protein Smc [Streptomyces griseoloalbus]